MTTETKDSALSQDIIADLDLDATLENVADLELDLDTVLQADTQDEEHQGPRLYDFNRPHSLSRRFSKNLRNIAELFSRNATVNLTSMLRSNVAVDFQGIVLRTYDDFVKSVPRVTCVAAMTARPLGGQSLIHLDLNLCFVIIKKLLGGRPESEDKVRPFTEIERGIINHFLKRLLDMLRTASAKLVELCPEIAALENNPDYISGIASGENMALLRFRIRLEAVESGLDLAFPLSAFTSVRSIFDPVETSELRSVQEVEQDQRQIMDLVQGTGSELVVRLGERSMSLDEVLALREGDIINLNQAVSAPLLVLIEDQEVFLAEPGRIHQNRAVKLVRQVMKE